MTNITLDPTMIASDAAAILLASTKLISTLQPVWAKLPKWLSAALPVIVATSPQVISYFAGVSTDMGLINAVAMSVALLVPGIEAAESPQVVQAKKILIARKNLEAAGFIVHGSPEDDFGTEFEVVDLDKTVSTLSAVGNSLKGLTATIGQLVGVFGNLSLRRSQAKIESIKLDEERR